MDKYYVEGKEFSKIEQPLTKGDYENCAFRNCNFASADLSLINFIDCSFEGCDLSTAIIKSTSFRDVSFKNCKLLGLRFDECNGMLLSFSFDTCILNFATFYKMKIKKIQFKSCKLQEVDFSECDLTQANFQDADLDRATFMNTLLEGADFRSAYNFSIDPERNRIKKAKFSAGGLTGLLEKYKIIVE